MSSTKISVPMSSMTDAIALYLLRSVVSSNLMSYVYDEYCGSFLEVGALKSPLRSAASSWAFIGRK